MNIQYSIVFAPLGKIFLAETPEGLCHIAFGEDGLKSITEFAKQWYPDSQIVPSILSSSSQVESYLEGKLKEFNFPLDVKGSEFQLKVWQALRDIPYGQTKSYGEIAEIIGQPNAAQAVGGACGQNPIAIVTPCHRVVSSDGSLGGFSGGVEWKKWLLELEGDA